LEDTYRHKGMRKRLIETLRGKGISDETVLTAMEALPRHFFLDKAFEDHAYDDKAFPIGNDQTISQPYTVAYQTSLLDIKPREKVLEIGTGSGYQAAILSMMGARLYSIERQELLYQKAKLILADLGLSARCYFKDGSKGLPEFAPFDKIIVTAGAPVVPQPLKEQLKIGGILIIPVGDEVQTMVKITRTSETAWQEEMLDNFRFVPFLEGVTKKKSNLL
jgi:protein-L-isoaspartate(D-aspartate) O-methyltransferase